MQKYSEFDSRGVLWRDILTSWEELLMFYLSKIIWCLRLTQSYLKIILSNRQCVLLLQAWWIYVNIQNVQKMQKQENSREKPNITIKDHGVWKIKKVTIRIFIELTIIFCVIDFPFDLDASKPGEVYPAIHRSGCRALLQ